MKAIRLYNTDSRSIEEFHPITPGQVGMYTCGPTVYHYVHLGNLRTFILNDTLKRVLGFNGLAVKHVMNITDVGHLVSDSDEGEDKLEKGASRQGQTVWQVAEFYSQSFISDMHQLAMVMPDIMAPATHEIASQQQLIQQLLDKDFAYQTDQAIYFDVTKFPQYWHFSGQKMEDKQVAVRDDVHQDAHKKHPADFALWFFTVGRFADHQMHWPSSWGEGFPGWHIECSAISMKYLGQEFDIHTGGIDLIGTHHPNEIAQSEAATGKKFAHYWVHGEFLNVEGGKMSRSLENGARLQSIIDKGFSPMDYRYFCLTAHYRTKLEFSWESMQQAAVTLKNLKKEAIAWPAASAVDADAEEQFYAAINNDLDMPTALSVVWEMVGSDLPAKVKRATLNRFEQVLGLGLFDVRTLQLDDTDKQLLQQRHQARATKDWATSDQLRQQLSSRGVEVEDTSTGTKWFKLP
jgi:cysteinyl-tRNA synthetase